MIRILTKDYEELDLSMGQEFQIEIENPMLDEGHLPSAFSTQISFPPSPANKRAFGYVPAMFQAPDVKRLEASIWIGGMPFLNGTLAYDGIEDGNIMYTFTERHDNLDGKIWEKSLLEFKTTSIPKYSSKFFEPLLIDKKNVAVQPYSKISRNPVKGEANYYDQKANAVKDDDFLYQRKYFNYTNSSERFGYDRFIPAIPLEAILSGCALKIPEKLFEENIPGTLSILGRYHEILFDDVAKPDKWVGGGRSRNQTQNGTQIGRPERRGGSLPGRGATTDLASFLPDISFAELIQGICSMFCATIYSEKGSLVMRKNDAVLHSSPLQWDGKISDDFSAEEEPAMSYKFGYGDGGAPQESDKFTQQIKDGKVETIQDRLAVGILEHFKSKDDYTVVFSERTGDVYSGRQYDGVVRLEYNKHGAIVPVTRTAYECDVIYQGSKAAETRVEGADVFDNSTDFLLAPCSPEEIFITDTETQEFMAAIIEPNATGGERDDKVYVGACYFDQFYSNGCFTPLTQSDALFLGRRDITPGGLWKQYHEAFAEWLAKRRQRVTADVNLSPAELHDFRMSAPVYFKGRKWIVAKLSVTLAAGSDMVKTRGEFIEM